MKLRLEIYEGGNRDRLFLDDKQVDLKGHTLDIEDLIPILRSLGVEVEAVAYDGNRPHHDRPNDAEPDCDIAALVPR